MKQFLKKSSVGLPAFLLMIISFVSAHQATAQAPFWKVYVGHSQLGNGLQSLHGGGGHLLGGWAPLDQDKGLVLGNPMSPLVVHTDRTGDFSQPLAPMITNFARTYQFRVSLGVYESAITMTSARILEDHFNAYIYCGTFTAFLGGESRHGLLYFYIQEDGTVSLHKTYLFGSAVTQAKVTGIRLCTTAPDNYLVTGNIEEAGNDKIFALRLNPFGVLAWHNSYDFNVTPGTMMGPGEKANDIIQNINNNNVHIVGGADFGSDVLPEFDGYILTVNSSTGTPILPYTRRVALPNFSFDEITSINENWENVAPGGRNFIMSGTSGQVGMRAWFMKADALCNNITTSMVYTNITRQQGYLYPVIVKQVFDPENNPYNSYVMGGNLIDNNGGNPLPSDVFYMDISNTVPNVGQCSLAHYADFYGGGMITYSDECKGIGYLTMPHTPPYVYGQLTNASAAFINGEISPNGCSYNEDQLQATPEPPAAPAFPPIITANSILTVVASSYLGQFEQELYGGCGMPQDRGVNEFLAVAQQPEENQSAPGGTTDFLEGLRVSILPNPATNHIDIIFSADVIQPRITIRNAVGAQVGEAVRISSQSFRFVTGNLAAGLYFAEITHGAERKMIRFIKE